MHIGIWVLVGIVTASTLYVVATEDVSMKKTSARVQTNSQSAGSQQTDSQQADSQQTDSQQTSQAPSRTESQPTTDSAPSILAGDPDEAKHDGGTRTDERLDGSDDTPAASLSTMPDMQMPVVPKPRYDKPQSSLDQSEYDAAVTTSMKGAATAAYYSRRDAVPDSDQKDESLAEGVSSKSSDFIGP